MEWPIFMSRLSIGSMTLAERAEWSFCHFRFNDDAPFYSKAAIEDMVANMIVFLAVGGTLSLVFEKKKAIVPFIGFGMSLFFELTQFFNTIGGFAYIDLITNTLGTILGMLLAYLIMTAINKNEKIASGILIVFQFIFSIIVGYGVYNTINHIEIYL
jgi:glycopeptide antibiotics resistance protein